MPHLPKPQVSSRDERLQPQAKLSSGGPEGLPHPETSALPVCMHACMHALSHAVLQAAASSRAPRIPQPPQKDTASGLLLPQTPRCMAPCVGHSSRRRGLLLLSQQELLSACLSPACLLLRSQAAWGLSCSGCCPLVSLLRGQGRPERHTPGELKPLELLASL